MADELSYTTEEISKLLRISKLTVYDLIKKGELPSYRVGRQMRVDATDLEAYKLRAKGLTSRSSTTLASLPPVPSTSSDSLVITGLDASLDILSRHIAKNNPAYRPLRSYVGSMDSLISMYQGQADMVSTHLLDGDTGEYNLPYIRRLLVGFPLVVIHLVTRAAGLYVRKGNPKGLSHWSDLKRPDVTIVNREKGSGARVLLDEQLRLLSIAPQEVNGYGNEESNHLGVAGKVATGAADTGVGIESAAYMVGVDFIPLIQERVDLVMLQYSRNQAWIEQVKGILRSDAFQNEVSSIKGYDLTDTGRILLETGYRD